MNSIFENAAVEIFNNEIKKWKESGGKVVGYTCFYMQCELFHAAGILPVRVRGIETSGMDIGDAYFGPYICTFPKCILQLAGSNKFSFLDGAVIIPGCDSMRRIDECWRKAGDDIKGIVPDYFYYFDVPHKIAPHGFDWFVDEILKLKKSIEEHFSVSISDFQLQESIRIYNEGRSLLKRADALRMENSGKISGTDAFIISISASSLPREIFNRELKSYLGEIDLIKDKDCKSKKVMLLGSANDDIEFIKLIESSGATIAWDNLCYGIESEAHEVSEEGDLIRELAKRYLTKSDCPRMFGGYKERISIIKNAVADAGIDGVIMQNIRFCDLHGSEHGIYERDLEREGIPCLRLEREYGPLVETGRIKMRIDAFMERMSQEDS